MKISSVKSSLALMLILFSSSAALSQSLQADKIEQYLKVDPVYFTEGDFKGLEIDQTLKRPVQLIPELETADSYFISHFYNQKLFWIAEIPKRAVKKVIFQLALFKGPLSYTLAHSQFRFLMEEPIKLYRVKNGQVRKTRTGDVIFTVQAALPAGKQYNAVESFKGIYKMAARLSNTYDRAQLEEVNEGDIVTQYELQNLSSEAMDLLLANSVQFSTENLLNKDYFATTDNCISVTFDLIDKSLALKKERVTLSIKNTLFNGKSPNEKMALDALKERNLINDHSRLQNFR